MLVSEAHKSIVPNFKEQNNIFVPIIVFKKATPLFN